MKKIIFLFILLFLTACSNNSFVDKSAKCLSTNKPCIISTSKNTKAGNIVLEDGFYKLKITGANYENIEKNENPMKRALYIASQYYESIDKLTYDFDAKTTLSSDIQSYTVNLKKGDWVYLIPLTSNEVGTIEISKIK